MRYLTPTFRTKVYNSVCILHFMSQYGPGLHGYMWLVALLAIQPDSCLPACWLYSPFVPRKGAKALDRGSVPTAAPMPSPCRMHEAG